MKLSLHRVPIIVTGNDFSTLYALIRDGWKSFIGNRPKIELVFSGIFEEDGLDQTEIEQPIDTFPSQSIDFWCFTFTGLRRASSRVY